VKPKRFVVFMYRKDRPAGGWHDLGTSRDTPQQSRAKVVEWEEQSRHHTAHVVDLEAGKIIPKEQ
jgi:hypothetical protein